MFEPHEEVKRFAITMTAELQNRIDKEAKRQRRSRSSLVRCIVEDYLKEVEHESNKDRV